MDCFLVRGKIASLAPTFLYANFSSFYKAASPRKAPLVHTLFARILNIACGADTARVVGLIREQFPDVPIIASGGKTDDSIAATIAAGANAITYTPPSAAFLFKEMMEKYREES